MGMFDKLIANLQAAKKTIVFTEGTDARILSATDRLLKEGLMGVVLCGNVDEVKAAAAAGGFTIDGAETRQIGRGFVVFLGVGEGDTRAEADKIWRKVSRMRIFGDEDGKTNLGLADVGGDLLVVSQFTLYANCRKGNRPSFAQAGEPGIAKEFYEYFVELARAEVPHVETGEFAADMLVELANDGPFTIWLDTVDL